MLFRNASYFAFAGMMAMATAGCRDSNPLTPADLSMAGGGGGGTGGGMDMATNAKNYMMATVAMMRQGAPGDYELDNVRVIAKTSSSASPHLVIQDDVGTGATDFTAMYTTCSATSSSHPCAATSDNKNAAVGDKLTIKGTYIKASNANGATETFYIDSISNGGPASGSAPAPSTVTLADLAKTNGTAMKAKWFQKVTVATPAAGALKVYDLIPSELVFSGTGCPKQVGWAMVPMATAACTGATVACPTPTTCASPDASEILIGTEFYKQFTDSSDCACAKTDMGTGSPLVTMTSATTGAIGGVLLYDSVFGSTPVKTFMYLSPTADSDMPLSNTM